MKASWAEKTAPVTAGLVLNAIIFLSLLTACGEPTHNALVEEARVTSPDGQFDAVMTRESIGGVLGGVYWNLFIVPRGTAVPTDDRNTLLDAAVLRGEKQGFGSSHGARIRQKIGSTER